MWTTFLLIFISTVLGAGAWLLFVWAVRSDQYEDVEGQKHRILDDEQDSTPESSNNISRNEGK
ncbi:MAG: cbb3-type cytochrome oxidase assembly protein CcoS [Candidatus Deferrimicrobiota bacterium]